MDSSQSYNQCKIGLSGADKICISEDCTLANPYVCNSCEQLHEHNGTILAVRANKVRDIYNKIKHRKQQNDSVVAALSQLKLKINNKIDDLIQERKQNSEQISQIYSQLAQFMEQSQFKSFLKTWNKIKNNSHVAHHKQLKSRKDTIEQLKKQLASLIQLQCASKQTQSPSNQNFKDHTAIKVSTIHIHNQFVQHFANIFCFLPLQLKLKPNQSVIKQIDLLKPSDKSQIKMMAKLCELCHQQQKSLQLYNTLLKQNSLDVQIINRKALLLKKMKKLTEAYDQFTLLIGLLKDKMNPELYYLHRGQICAEMGRFNQAMNQYQKCVGKQGLKAHNLQKSIGLMLQKQGKYAQAIKSYKKSLENEHTNQQIKYQILENLYQCATKANDNQLSLECLNKLSSNKPGDLQILLKRARLYHNMKQYENAVKDYTVVIEKENKNPGIFYNRAVQLIYLGQSQQSIPDLKKAIELNPQFKEAVHLLASTCFELLHKNQPTEVATQLKQLAINSYQYCLNFFKNNEGIYHNLGILLTDTNPQKAYQCFKNATQLNPKLNASYVGKIKTAILLRKDPKQSMQDIQILISNGDRTVSTFLMKSVIQEELGLYEEAIKTAELILKADPQNQSAKKIKQRLLQYLEKKKEISKQEEIKQISKTEKANEKNKSIDSSQLKPTVKQTQNSQKQNYSQTIANPTQKNHTQK